MFAAEGLSWVLQHMGMLFGATSAVYAWHRFGNLLTWIILTSSGTPLGQYVDDLFGAYRCGVFWKDGKLLDILGLDLGVLWTRGSRSITPS